MTGKHIPPKWIEAYDGGPEFWPPFWDQGVLRRILSSPEACSRLDTLSDNFGSDTGQEVLEACLSARGLWESAPKVPKGEQESAVSEIGVLTSKLIKAIQTKEEALRAHRALPLSLGMLFPERAELWGSSEDEPPPLQLDDVLNRFYESLGVHAPWEGALPVPAKPNHASAFRTCAVQILIRLLRSKTGQPMYSVVADLVNIIIDDPNASIEPTHVAKLDPGEKDFYPSK